MKNIFSKIYALDDKILRVVNDAYLWVMDWTGIYVGSIMLVIGLPSFLDTWAISRIMGSLLLISLVICSFIWYMTQNANMQLMFNMRAEDIRSWRIRYFFIVFNLGELPIDIVWRHSLMTTVMTLLAFAWWYVVCIKIRDREKKKFLLPKMAYGVNT